MESARPSNTQNLLSLHEAAQLLGVSPNVLISWNEHNILKPTINPSGQIGYVKQQIDQFLAIRQPLNQAEDTLKVDQKAEKKEAQVNSINHEPLDVKPSQIPIKTSNRHLSGKYVSTFAAGFAVILIAVFIFQGSTALPKDAMQNQDANGKEKILSSQASSLKLSDLTPVTLPTLLKNEIALAKNLRVEGDDALREKAITRDILSSKSLNNNSTQSEVIATLLGQNIKDGSGDKNAKTPGLSVYASKGCAGCNTSDESNLVFDENGDLRGEVKSDTVTSAIERIGLGLAVETLGQSTSNPKLQLFLLPIAMLIFIFIFRNQPVFAFPRHHSGRIASSHPAPHTWQKVLEVEQKTDGTVFLICLEKEYKISKPEMNSESDQFIERLMKLTEAGVKEIEYDLTSSDSIRLITPLSRLVTRLGFVGIKRDLFFPRTSKNSVLFRRYLTNADLASMNLTTGQILADLTGSTN